SSNAVLTVTPVAIVVEPKSQAVLAGGTVSFSVKGSGLGPLSYQWRKDGVNIFGATDSTYTFPSAQAGDQGIYDVVVGNGFGSVTSFAERLFISPGTVLAWGNGSNPSYGTSLTNVPPDLTDAVAIAAGTGLELALRANGTVRFWGGSSGNYSQN